VIAFYYCFSSVGCAAFFYLLGQGLDAVDGTVARMYGQSSNFGAVLDMLTDRMSTATLLVVLALLYRQWWGFFAFLIVLDIVSHWYQMYSKATSGARSHKGSRNPWLNFYYTGRHVLLVCCVGNEFCLVSFYVAAFTHGPAIATFGAWTIGAVDAVMILSFPIFVFKQLMNFVQLYDAASEIAARDLRNHLAHPPAAAAAAAGSTS